MAYPYEKLLRAKAELFINQMQSQLGYDAQIDPKSYREYSVGVKLGDMSGKAVIYYSPKKQTYKLVNQGVDKSISEMIMTVWDTMADTTSTPKKQALETPKTAYQAFVDGSYHAQKKTVGYGAVILHDEQEQARLSGRVHQFTESHQIGGELEATMQVIRWCEDHDIAEIDIYYDYKGIEMWATRRWKTEKPISQNYKKFMQATAVKVHWHKVKSHTGVHWNEVADDLAKQGTLS
ncbi:MAG: RNase H family protein [Phototrophicaceae bacterium]